MVYRQIYEDFHQQLATIDTIAGSSQRLEILMRKLYSHQVPIGLYGDVLKRIDETNHDSLIKAVSFVVSNLDVLALDGSPKRDIRWNQKMLMSATCRFAIGYEMEALQSQFRYLIYHENGYVRARAADVLLTWGVADAIQVLEELLLDHKELIWADNIYPVDISIVHLYIKRLKLPLTNRQLALLIKALEKSVNFTRLSIIDEFKLLKDIRTIPILIQLLNDSDRPYHKWADTFKPFSYYAAEALEAMGTPEALAAVEKWRLEEARHQQKQQRHASFQWLLDLWPKNRY